MLHTWIPYILQVGKNAAVYSWSVPSYWQNADMYSKYINCLWRSLIYCFLIVCLLIKNNQIWLYIFGFTYYLLKMLFIVFNMRKEEILRLIKETIAKTMLSGAKVILFGPQARGDAREDSDWDILILLNKDKVELDDHDYISYPFFELGWRNRRRNSSSYW